MRRPLAAVLLFFAVAASSPAQAMPWRGVPSLTFLERVSDWLVSVFEKEGPAQDPWGPPEITPEPTGAVVGSEHDSA